MENKSLNNVPDAQIVLKENENQDQILAQYSAQAEKLISENKWLEAIELYKKVVELAPSDYSLLGKLGFCYSRNQQHNQAIGIFSQLSDKEPLIARWPYMIGYQYYDKKEWAKAITFFDKAIALKSDYIKALYRNAYARIQSGDSEGAEPLLLRCIDNYQQLDDTKKLNEKNRYSDICFQLGKLYLEKGFTLKAEKWLKEAIDLDNNDEYKHYNLGKALLKNKRIPQALEEFNIANGLHPQLDYIQDKIAYTNLQAGNLEEAEKIYQSIPSYKRKPYVWSHYGVTLLQNHKPDEAVKALKNAVKTDGHNHKNHYYLGLAYLDIKEISLAVKELELAVKLRREGFDLEYKEALEKLQEIYQKYGDSFKLQDNGNNNDNEGIIEQYVEKRGFGFIRTNNDEKIFFHISGIENPKDIKIGRKVNFERTESEKGPKAIKILVVL